MYCNKDTNFKMKLRPSGDDDIPHTDKQIRKAKKEKKKQS